MGRNVIRIGREARYLQQGCLALLIGLASFLQAQIADTCENLTVAVSVRDHQGKFVANLSSSSFQVKSQGHPVAVSEATVGGAPRILLLVDVSGSISGSPHQWEVERLIAGSVLTSSHGNANVALVLFASEIVESLDFTSSPWSALKRIQRLSDIDKLAPKDKRRTALYDSLLQSLGLFGTPLAGDAVYVVSDGEDNKSRATTAEVERKLLARAVRLYTFLTHPDQRFMTPEGEPIEATFANLAEATGGRLVDVPRAGPQLQADLKGVYDETTQFYGLQLLRAAAEKERAWSLEVVDDKRKRRKDVILNYPHRRCSKLRRLRRAPIQPEFLCNLPHRLDAEPYVLFQIHPQFCGAVHNVIPIHFAGEGFVFHSFSY